MQSLQSESPKQSIQQTIVKTSVDEFLAVSLPELFQNPDELHVMIDLETLALTEDAAITEIGAVLLVAKEGDERSKFFQRDTIDTFGRKDPNTIRWRKENELPWIEANVPKTVTLGYALNKALVDLNKWVESWKLKPEVEVIFWCKGTNFDAKILSHAYRIRGLTPFWKYYNIADLRTILRLFPQFKVPKDQIPHKALTDALIQSMQLIYALRELDRLKGNGV